MVALLGIALFAGAFVAVAGVAVTTLLPAMPRIIALLATGIDPAAAEPIVTRPWTRQYDRRVLSPRAADRLVWRAAA